MRHHTMRRDCEADFHQAACRLLSEAGQPAEPCMFKFDSFAIRKVVSPTSVTPHGSSALGADFYVSGKHIHSQPLSIAFKDLGKQPVDGQEAGFVAKAQLSPDRHEPVIPPRSTCHQKHVDRQQLRTYQPYLTIYRGTGNAKSLEDIGLNSIRMTSHVLESEVQGVAARSPCR